LLSEVADTKRGAEIKQDYLMWIPNNYCKVFEETKIGYHTNIVLCVRVIKLATCEIFTGSTFVFV